MRLYFDVEPRGGRELFALVQEEEPCVPRSGNQIGPQVELDVDHTEVDWKAYVKQFIALASRLAPCVLPLSTL